MGFVVAVDGPAGSGKGTVTKEIAKRTNLINVDTGAMYRSVTLECINNDISSTDLEKIKQILENIDIQLIRKDGNQIVLLNGKDVTKEIRTPKVDSEVAKFAAIKEIRDKVTPIQQKMGEDLDIIMEGRDIGTVVFPNADVKIFLDCSVEERARRRYKQNQEKGINISYEEVLESIIKRHILETTREVAPLVQPKDAKYIDSTNMSIEEVVNTIVEIINAKKLEIEK